MRSWALLLLLIAVGLLAGHEWKKAGRDLNYAVTDSLGPSRRETATQAGQSAAGPALSLSELRIQKQQKKVAELEKARKEKKAAIDELDRKRNAQERGTGGGGDTSAQLGALTPEEAQDRLTQARAALASAEGEKVRRLQQQHQEQQAEQAERARNEEGRLNAEFTASQLRDQLAHEQATLRELNRRLQEERAKNLNSTEQHELEGQVPAQAQRVARVEAQYRDLMRQYYAQEAASRARAGSVSPSAGDLAALDERIREQQRMVTSLESEVQNSQRRQQAGMAASEALGEQYLQQKRDYDALTQELEAEQRALEQLKNPASG